MNSMGKEGEEYSSNIPSRPTLRVSDILEAMEPKNFTISQTASVLDAINHLIKEKLASALVVNNENEIMGIFTARDVLKCIQQQNEVSMDYRPRRTNLLTDIKIKELMTSKQQLVYCSPSDSARRCREIMFQCKIRNLPVIDKGEVRGIITAKLLADASFNLKDTGGKKGFIHNVTGRRGIPEGTRINEASIHLKDRRRSQQVGKRGYYYILSGYLFCILLIWVCISRS
jgi:CBS domain-containing protein